jgi:glycosyltransferase involved in cell wall biosynthesis
MQNVLHDSKFIVVDGNSVDKTIEIAKNMGADVLLQEGKGKGNAMSQAYVCTVQNPILLYSQTLTTLTLLSMFLKCLIF